MSRGRAIAPLLALALGATAVPAQAIRVSGTTSARYIELRSFERDSVLQADVEGTAVLRQLPDGRVVRCVPGDTFCRDVRPGARLSTVPVLHDVDVSAWGFGEGVRLHAQVRARSAFGAVNDLWPRAEDPVDLLAAYGEVERERVRVRAGRQWKVSGLGFYNFDGVAVAGRPLDRLSVEVYGGRSLVRGLNESRSGGALEAVEPFAPPRAGILGGLHVRGRPVPALAVGALYQLDVQRDRRAVHAERAAVDAVLQLRGAALEGTLEADVAAAAINEARLQLRAPPIAGVALFGEVRRHRPYFELWTIWGAFSPVGFDEVRSGATWAGADGRLILRGEAALRSYRNDDIASSPDPLRDDGWTLATGASWAPARAWRVEGSHRIEHGFGAARRDLHAGVRRELGGDGSLALTGMLFERVQEFRLSEGRVAGLGAEAGLPLSPRTRLFAAAAVYRHVDRGLPTSIDWNQRRATLRLQWALGTEPGSVAAPRGAR